MRAAVSAGHTRRLVVGQGLRSVSGASALVLAACGTDAPSTASTQVEGTVTLWTTPLIAQPELIWKPLTERFQAEQPKTTIDVQALPAAQINIPAAVAAGSPPDVAYTGVQSIVAHTALDAIVDLEDTISPAVRKDLFPNVLEHSTYTGKLWLSPVLTTVVTPFYNLDLVERAGLDPAKLPATWQQLEEWAVKLHRPANDEIAISHNWSPDTCSSTMYNWLPQAGAAYADEPDGKKALFSSPAGIEALEFPVRLFKRELIPPECARNQGPAFTGGKVGILLFGSNGIARAHAQNFPNLRYRAGPILEGKKRSGFGTIAGYQLFKASKSKPAAKEFLRFMLRPASVTHFLRLGDYMPPLRSIDPTELFADNEQLRRMVDEVRYTQPGSKHRNTGELNRSVAKHSQRAVAQEVSARQALEAAAREFEAAAAAS